MAKDQFKNPSPAEARAMRDAARAKPVEAREPSVEVLAIIDAGTAEELATRGIASLIGGEAEGVEHLRKASRFAGKAGKNDRAQELEAWADDAQRELG